MNSIQFVIQPLPGTDEQFIERLREVSDKINKLDFGTHRIFEQLKIPVKEVVIGPCHIGVLLEDGKAFRVAYSINSERLDLSKTDSAKSNTSNTNPGVNSKNSVPSSSRQLARSRARLMRSTSRSGATNQSAGSRSTGVIISGSSSTRPLVTVPATYVPEELISQAEVVLQGKSRNLIIRELQRTNLDVNLAVNNLLSRDDEEAEDAEEGGDNYVPEDLISLLDNGFHSENNSVIIDPSDGLFSEEIFSNYSSIRNLLFDRIRNDRNQTSSNGENSQNRASAGSGGVLSGLSSQISSVSSDREAFSRWRDRQYYGPKRWVNKDDYIWEKEADIKRREPCSTTSPIWISEELQPWPVTNNGIRFKKIEALYSEFIALSENGELHQWRWADIEPFKSEVDNCFHPKTTYFNITEKVELISANFIRCSVVTENNYVATWMDEQLGYLGNKLEHPPTAFTEFLTDPIMSINVCSLYTVVRTENNSVYWWGILPFDQRRYLWEKFRTKTKKPIKSLQSDLTVGTQVIMKKCPIYQSGSIGFTCANGVPKVGQLINSIWDFNDVCRFKILNVINSVNVDKFATNNSNSTLNLPTEKDVAKSPLSTNAQTAACGKITSNKETTDRIDMPPPPSPASSTCSDTGSVTPHKRSKRVVAKDEGSEHKKDEELWQLKDVVFVEDKIGPIGKILKIDGDFVAVRFPINSNGTVSSAGCSGNGSAANPSEGKDDDWQQCRLLRRDDIQIFKTAMTSRGPDWQQRLPKKINIINGNELSTFQFLAMAADTRGLHVIKKIGLKLHYSLYNLYNSKQEQNCVFPTDSTSFLGSHIENISMQCNNDCSGTTSSIILRDGNRAIYPISKDNLGSIKDPQWIDLPPIKAVSMSTVSVSPTTNNLKSKVCIAALLFQPQILMPHILRCDVKNAIAILSRLEDESVDLITILDERCDGCRNILHACTAMCAPTSNKESTDEKKVSTANICRSSSSTPLFSNTNITIASESTSQTSNVSTTTAPVSTTSSTGPSSSSTGPNREGRTVSLRDMMNRLINNEQSETSNTTNLNNVEDLCVPSWSIESNVSTPHSNISEAKLAGSEDDFSKMIGTTVGNAVGAVKLSSPNYILDSAQRRDQAILILQQLCSSSVLRPYLYKMLSAKDAQGHTPFMLAVYNRAYDAGLILLNTILNIVEKESSPKDSMIFPVGSPLDQSPLHVICYNDTCSFTWTGADHINQNIYECKTCGLTGSLCCCTECARVCHKGHDCKIKKTSPTAYCDCWEKCKCKALISGNQGMRFTLLCKLVSCTDLVTKFNSKGESILLFLIQTVGRQMIEQRQYRANTRVRNIGSNGSTGTSTRKTTSIDLDADMPEHDLEPPKFARKALDRLLVDWSAIRSTIMAGADKNETLQKYQCNNSKEAYHTESYNIYLHTQNGSTLLDKFTHNLFVKCSAEHLDILLAALVREMQNNTVVGRILEAEKVARRFVRSVVRIFVVFSLEKLPNPEKRKSNSSPNKHIQSCIKVFQTLCKISIQELCEVSEALIAPVRLGVVRPTAPFTMSSSSSDNSDELFSVEPLAPYQSESNNEHVPIHDPQHEQSTSFNMQSNYSMENIDALRDASENDESSNRDGISHSQDEELLHNTRNEEGIADDESENDFVFPDAETESDSDDNQSNQDAQRSVQTGATAGSETDESGDSSPQEEEPSEDGETDDHSDDFNFADHQLERRNTTSSIRNDLAPQSMQWAIRNREQIRSSVRVPAGSSLVFIDPMALRRSTVPSNSTVSTGPVEQHTMATTASNLARAFGIIVRQISELLCQLSHHLCNNIQSSLKVQFDETIQLQAFVETQFSATWKWMFSVLDGTEAQLKFGAYLTNFTDPTHPLHPLNSGGQSNINHTTTTPVGLNPLNSSSRREFFSYCLSLMRAHTSEHRDSLPVLDITALRHIAYVFDGFINYLRNDVNFYEKNEISPSSHPTENDDTDDELSNITGNNSLFDSNVTLNCANSLLPNRRISFFMRSDSTLSLGCLAPEGFELPLDVAMPLADKPHLLQPNSKREDLFANLPLLSFDGENNGSSSLPVTSSFESSPTKLSFSTYSQNIYNSDTISENKRTSEDEKQNQLLTANILSSKASHFQIHSETQTENRTSSSVVQKLQEENLNLLHGEENGHTTEQSDIAIKTRPDVIIIPTVQKQTESIVQSVIMQSGSPLRNVIKTENSQITFSMFPARGLNFFQNLTTELNFWNYLLGRWKLTLDLFGRVFMDDVGMEHGSILPELRGFPVKEMRFRRHMEKLRNGQQRDLILSKLERNRDIIILQTFKELNTQFGSQSKRLHPPLAFNRVKVTFKDEPGEGSGVARSFYTSISEAILSSAKIPNLETAQVGSNNKYGVPFSSMLRNRGISGRDLPTIQRRGSGSKILWRTARERKILNYDARPYIPTSSNTESNPSDNVNDHLSVHVQQLGERLFPKIYSLNSSNASKITGMLLEIPTPQLLSILSSEETLRQKVNEALEIINFKQKPELSNNSVQTKKMIPVVLLEQCQIEDNEPLFYSPGKRGFYTPRQGYGSFERINAFRNVGRLIGLCLLQNELLPLFLQRHVLKYILSRRIKFHDLAFFDPAIYESFRKLLQHLQTEDGEDIIRRMELYFEIDLIKEEGGGSVELLQGGREVQVTSKNVFEYIRRYTEYRLIKSQEKALESLKDGVFDVLPESCLNSLTSEDLRLLLNGVGDINVSTLISYTTFNDESSEGSDKLLKFKRWFWSIVEKMSTLEKQDLVYFWTGSPALPASEEGFQPLPSVTIRPADDSHLPTANTCISRLYIPLYSSKSILRSKLLMAIKSKNFGFV